MRTEKDHIAHSSIILGVRNIEESIDFYQEILGFTCTFKWQEPPTYAVVKRGDTSIHLAFRTDPVISSSPILYIFCNDINSYYQEILKKGAKILEPLSSAQDYGMNEFALQDNIGYRLIFGSQRSTT